MNYKSSDLWLSEVYPQTHMFCVPLYLGCGGVDNLKNLKL